MDLLFELATWHALAKLRLHMETTLRALDTSTKRLGDALHTFKKVTCVAYITKELPSEEAAWRRRQAALRAKQTPSVPSVRQLARSGRNTSIYQHTNSTHLVTML
jgi:hypothetical protein